VKTAACKFLIPFSRQLKEEYRDYKDVKGGSTSKDYLVLSIHYQSVLLNVSVASAE